MKKNFIIFLSLFYCLNLFSQEGKSKELKSAILLKDKDLVCKLINQGADVNVYDTSGTPLLFYAAQTGDVELFKCLINDKTDLNVKGILWSDSTPQSYYGSLLCITAGYGYYDLAKYMINELNFDVNKPEMTSEDSLFTGWSPLIWTAYNGKTKVLKYLVTKGANLDYFSKSDSATALMYAVINSNDTAVNYLLIVELM